VSVNVLLEELAGVMERMALVMSECAANHRDNGDEEAAKHCAGGAEAWAMAAAYLRLRMTAESTPNLKVVS
jgi:hypothetical protein